jgi:hypothetical protein
MPSDFPEPIDNTPKSGLPEFPEKVEIDPYYLWTDLEPEQALPYDQVQEGLAKFLAYQLRRKWDQLTTIKIPWYLRRDAGLRAWSRYEAGQRLAVQPRQSYTAAQFHELHFSEVLRKRGQAELSNSEWDDLFRYKRQIGDLKFFEHIALIVNQSGVWQHLPMQLFCAFFDRLDPAPFEYWAHPAASEYLIQYLQRYQLNTQGITPEALRQWAHRLGLKQSRPSVVEAYNARRGVADINFSAAAEHGLVWPISLRFR